MVEEVKEKEKLNRLDELKSRLWSNGYQTRIEHHGFFPQHGKTEVSESWSKGEVENALKKQNKFFMKTSMFKKFFMFSILFFVVAIIYASYVFFLGGSSVSNNNIDIAVLGKTFTSGGAELPLVVEITNRNNSDLELVDLIIEYPTGVSHKIGEETERIRISIGTIKSGAIHNENIKLVLFGEQGSVNKVKISLEYRIASSNSIFFKEKDFEVTIDSAPINLLFNMPNEISPNQDLKLDIKATLNANKPLTKILIKVEYPPGFEFITAIPSPTSGNNIWSLGDLAPGAERDIFITGKMVDVLDGEEKSFRVRSGSELKNDRTQIGVVLNSLKQSLTIRQSSIDAILSINGSVNRELAIDFKTTVQGQISWKNNLDTKINDLEIRAKITGNAYNRKSIESSDGFYNSLDGDVIIWDKNSSSVFANVSPGDGGVVSFSLVPLPLFSSLGGILSSPSINIEVSIVGKQSLDGNGITPLNNSESKIIRIISDVGFNNKALYYSGPFENKGTLPPKVGQETTYTITWSLSNTSNNISKTQVTASLPAYMRYVGTLSPAFSDVNFNPNTRQITWNVGNLNKGASITTASKEVSFQVGLTPSLSQIDTTPIIINEAVLTGHDDFANVDVRVGKGALNIRLNSDPQFLASGAKVVE
ncbi:MAG: DUF11 domain-containing protein [bacterium]|nr:DUF11 domain-containing protein [bacterium]